MKDNRLFQLDEIDFFRLLVRLVKDAWIAVIGAISAVLMTIVFLNVTYQPVYTSSTTFAVSSNVDATTLSSAMDLATVFQSVFQSEILRNKVAEELNMTTLNCGISTSVISQTNLLVLQVAAYNPEDAFRIIQGIITYYPEVARDVMGNISLQSMNTPNVPLTPSNPLQIRTKVMKIGFFTFITLLIVLVILYAFRGTIMTEVGAKRNLDGQLLGVINKESKNKTLKTKVLRTYKNILIGNLMTGYVFTENIHKIAIRISFAMNKIGAKSIMVTSTGEKEGKSTIAVNFALSFASAGHKVLLIDGDLQNPTIYKILGVEKDEIEGYASTIINEENEKKEEKAKVIACKQSSNIQLLLENKNYENSERIWRSEQIKQLINRYRDEVDYIIVDTPSLNTTLDAEIITEIVDASVLVVYQDKEKIEYINDALDQLSDCKASLLGYVLNGVSQATFKKSYGYEKK